MKNGTARNMLANNIVKGFGDNYNLVQGNQLNLLLCEIPEVIEWPANVTLVGTLTGISASNGITIVTNDVTIDLAGHALVGVPGSRDGIEADDVQGITVKNGDLRDWGFRGIDIQSTEGSKLLR